MDSNYLELHDRLEYFLQEALPIAERTVNPSEYNQKSYHVELKNGKEIIIGCDDRNWNRSGVVGDVFQIMRLESYIDTVEICKKNPQIAKHNNKSVFAFPMVLHFSIEDIPIQFLRTLIFLERGYTFQKSRFESIFSDFLTFISNEHYSVAKVIVPLSGIEFSENLIELDKKNCIKKVNSQEILEFLNLHPDRDIDYLIPTGEWHKFFFEFKINIEWPWLDGGIPHEFDREVVDKGLHSQDFSGFIQHEINKEIVILRALTNHPISGRPFALMYTGWFSPNTRGGGIETPWNSPRDTAQLSAENLSNYQKYRERFQNIENEKIRQQIFVAMRKLAFSMDKLYSGDEVLDTISGLEGLLVKEKNEVTHKCAERTAILLEQDIEKRIKLQKDIREAYGLRSSVAHGSAIIDDEDSVISKRYSKGRDAALHDLKTLNKNRNLKQISRDSLHQAILICIKEKTTNFDWDGAVMGKKILKK